MWIVLLIILAAMLLVHMARPRVRRRRISSADFFRELPRLERSQTRLRWNWPERSAAFWLRMGTLALLLLALLSVRWDWRVQGAAVRGLAVFLDTSASMSTSRPDGGTRFEAALEQLQAVARRTSRLAGDSQACFRLMAFDLELRRVADAADAAGVLRRASALSARPLGTDLRLVQAAIERLEEDPGGECPAGAAVVISDRPAPEWASPSDAWIDVGLPADNVGFTSLAATRDPLTGRVQRVQIEARAWGKPPEGVRLTVEGPSGEPVLQTAPEWTRGRFTAAFQPPSPGRYRLRISPGGGYAYDDHAALDVPAARNLRVDWRIPGGQLPRQLGWALDPSEPDLRVQPASQPVADTTPTLLVGPGYRPDEAGIIAEFQETSPLLEGLNFDVAEQLGIEAADLPDGFKPVLSGRNGPWIAWRESPPAAYVPGPPLGTEDDAGRFSATAFFNAVRQLLGNRSFPPLYTLTTPLAPQPEGTRLALHPGEGHTAWQPRSLGAVESLGQSQTRPPSPLWPLFLTAAALLFLLERLMSAQVSSQLRRP